MDLTSSALRALSLSASVLLALILGPTVSQADVSQADGALANPGQPIGIAAIHLDTDPVAAPTSVVAVGLDQQTLATLEAQALTAEDWRTIFPVYTGSELPTDGRPAVAGNWAVDGDVLRFRPQFPFEPGLAYVAKLDTGRLTVSLETVDGASPIVTTFALPAEIVEPSTVVSQVFPTADELPENLLRLYIHFSAPMSRGEATHHIRLLHADGQPTERPFLDIDQELWDHGMRRLTLFFDPGRIKRGLRPHFEAGPPLTAGSAYRLVIDRGWRDANDQPLVAGFEKTFRITAPDRSAPSPADWTLVAPAAAGREPLELRFPEPLDHGLLQRVIHVDDADGKAVAGDIEITDGERRFRFHPQAPWRVGAYTIAVETILEDVAGNNLNTVFDVDAATSGSQAGRGQTSISLPFDVNRR